MTGARKELNGYYSIAPELKTSTVAGKIAAMRKVAERNTPYSLPRIASERLTKNILQRALRAFPLEPRVFVVPRQLWTPPRVSSSFGLLSSPAMQKRLAEFAEGLERIEPDPRVDRFAELVEVCRQGDDRAVERFVVEELGVHDSLTVVALEALLDAVEHDRAKRVWTVDDLYDEFLAHHRKRIRDKASAARADKHHANIRRGIKVYGRLATSLDHQGGTLEDNLPGAAYLAESEGTPEARLGAEAANLIARGGSRRSVKPAESLDDRIGVPGVDEDHTRSEKERLQRILEEVLYGDAPLMLGFNERDLLVLARKNEGRADEEVAEELGVSNGYLRNLRSAAYEKVRRLA